MMRGSSCGDRIPGPIECPATVALLVVQMLWACGDDPQPASAPTEAGRDAGVRPDAGGNDAGGGPQTPEGPGACDEFDSSFQAIQRVIFEGHGCTAAACHGEQRAGDLDLRPDTAYENLVDAAASGSGLARVQPGTATESYLYLKLAAATEPGSVEIAGSPMPVGQSALSASELAAVQLWIKKGAPETGYAADAITGQDVGSLLDACAQPVEPVTVTPLEAPAEDEGIQFVLPSYVLKSGTEVENCTALAYDFADKVPARFKDEARNVMFVNGARVRQDAQSHHLVLYNHTDDLEGLTGDLSTWTCRAGDHDGSPCDPRKGSLDCGDGSVCADVPGPPFGGACSGFMPSDTGDFSPQLANTQAPQEYIPPIDGVYWEVPLRGVLGFNSHAFNLTEQDTVLHARVNFYFTENLERKLVPVNVIDDLYIAAGQPPFTRKTYCGEYTVPRGDSITVMTFHTHRRGEHSWVNHPSLGMIYENFDYNDPLYKHFDPWLDFDSPDPAERTLEYCATYNNGLTLDDEPDIGLVTRASRMPEGRSCDPVACVAGKIAEPCAEDEDCDTAEGAGDGSCDACPITRGTSTEDEMFVLMPWQAKPAE